MKTKLKETDTRNHLAEHLERKHQLGQEIDAAKLELAAANDELGQRNLECEAAGIKLRDIEERAAADADAAKRYSKSLADARTGYAQANEARAGTQNRVDSLHAFLRESMAALDAPGMTVNVEHVLDHQKRLGEAQAAVDQLRGLLDEHEGNARQASEISDPLQDLMRQREELLAESALGKDCSEAIAKLDAEIAEKGQAFDGEIADREGRVQHATQTAAGLRRRLADAQAELDRLQAMTPEVKEQFLYSEVEAACGEYMKAAKVVSEKYLSLMARERIYRLHTGTSGRKFMTAAAEDLLLPTFRLKACEGVPQHDPARGVLFSGNNAGYKSSDGLSEYDRQAQAERQRFESLGISPLLIP